MWNNLARAEWEMQMRVERAQYEVEQARLAREAKAPENVHPWWRRPDLAQGWLRRLASAGLARSSLNAAAT